jgi:reactive chlorine resistance protein C
MSRTAQTDKGTVSFADQRPHGQTWLNRVGVIVSRYGLVVILLLIGVEKFTPAEAEGIRPLIDHSPVMAWMYSLMSQQEVSNSIGAIEVFVAILMALRPFSARVSFFGSLGATATFLITVSFIITTPGVFIPGHWFPLLGDIGQFLIKDLVLLGAALWTAADAFDATRWMRA